MTIHGKRTRKPRQEDYPLNIWDKPEYGHGKNVTIDFENNKYTYCIFEKGYAPVWCINCNNGESPFYISFNTLEETKDHIVNNFGGKWLWN